MALVKGKTLSYDFLVDPVQDSGTLELVSTSIEQDLIKKGCLNPLPD